MWYSPCTGLDTAWCLNNKKFSRKRLRGCRETVHGVMAQGTKIASEAEHWLTGSL